MTQACVTDYSESLLLPRPSPCGIQVPSQPGSESFRVLPSPSGNQLRVSDQAASPGSPVAAAAAAGPQVGRDSSPSESLPVSLLPASAAARLTAAAGRRAWIRVLSSVSEPLIMIFRPPGGGGHAPRGRTATRRRAREGRGQRWSPAPGRPRAIEPILHLRGGAARPSEASSPAEPLLSRSESL